MIHRALALLIAVMVTVGLAPGEAHAKKKVPEQAELAQVVGAPGAPWMPVVFKELKKGMSPDEVRALFPRLRKVSYFGYAVAKVKKVPGVWRYVFEFSKDPDNAKKRVKLERATIVYVKWLTRKKEFFERMRAVTEAKWGKIADQERVDRRIITWVEKETGAVTQLSRIGPRYELSYTFP